MARPLQLRKLLPNLAFLSVASRLLLGSGHAEQDNPNFFFSLPSQEWSFAEVRDNDDKTAKLELYQRKALKDSSDADVVPTIGFIVEDGSPYSDSIIYSASCRTRKPFEVEQVFTWESGPLTEKRAVGYLGFYLDRDQKRHKIMVIHALKGKVAIQVVMDVTEELYPSVQTEFEKVAKSFRFL